MAWWRRGNEAPGGDPPASPLPPEDEATAAEISSTASGRDSLFGLALSPDEETLPDSLAGFRVVRKLGQGGMGLVYEAEEEHPRRRVALKVLRAGSPGDGVRARLFRREVEALARLHHPGIAALFEAGHTVDGLEYFAMELVAGLPLHLWARGGGAEGERRPPALEERLRVFVRACEAIAYAHTCGVIHRDLKPSNVVVDAARGVVKVLDFGLARVAGEGVAADSEAGLIRGTLAYMSPEQVRADPASIDARSDVYALGVLLYELVTGWLPYDVHWNRLAEAARVICEDRPRPLTRVAGAVRRGVDADLRTIVLKALEKRPADRYASAHDLAADITRYLEGQPIAARPPSALYQLRKVVQRHRLASTFAAALLLVLLAFGSAMAVQSSRLARERDRAARESARAQQVSRFLARLFEGADPDETRGSTVTVREVLDRGAERISAELAGQPEVEAELLNTMAWSYQGLGHSGRAVALAEQALAARRRAHGAQDPAITAALVTLGALLREKGDLAAAEARLHEAQAQPGFDSDSPTGAGALNNLALVCWETGRTAEAEPLLRQALAVRQRWLGDGHEDVANSLNNLALVLSDLGRYAEAEQLFREALSLRRRVLGDSHPRTLNSMHLLGRTLRERGRLDEGEPLVREALAGRLRVLGASHPDLIHSYTGLAGFAQRRGDYAGAEQQLRQALALAEALPGRATRRQARVRAQLGAVLDRQGRTRDAIAQYEQAVAMYAEAGPGTAEERARAEAELARLRSH